MDNYTNLEKIISEYDKNDLMYICELVTGDRFDKLSEKERRKLVTKATKETKTTTTAE